MKRRRVAAATMVALSALMPCAAHADFNPQGRVRKKPPASAKPTAPARPPAQTPSTRSVKDNETAPARADGPSQAALIQRYKALVLSQPGAAFPLQRLAELYRERDGSLDALLSEFKQRSVTAGSERYATLIALAGLLEQAGQTEEATRQLRLALELKPTDPAALLALAQAEESAGNNASARSLLERALPLITSDIEQEQIARRLMGLALDAGDYEAAKLRHADLVRRGKASFLVRAELGRELAARENWPLAEAQFRELVRSSAGDNRALGPALRDLGRALAAQDKTDEALTTFKRALGLVSESGLEQELLDAVADLYRRRNQLAEFVTELGRERREDAVRLRMVGKLLEETGQIDGALAAYKKALAQKPNDIDLRLRLIRLAQLQGQLDEAIAGYRELIAVAPRNPDYVFQLSDALLQRGDKAAALQELAKLEARAGEDEQTLTALVSAFERMGEQERSQKLLERLARSGSIPEHLVQLGSRYYRDGDSDKAVKTWKRLLTAIPNRAKALLALGEVYLEHDLAEPALEALKAAVELEPRSIPLRKALATALERTGPSAAPGQRLQRYEDARKIWEQFLSESRGEASLEAEARQHIITLWGLGGTLGDRVRPLERNLRATPPNLASGRLLAEVYIRLRRNDQAERVLRTIVAAAPGDAASHLRLERVLVLQRKLAPAIEVLEKLIGLDPKRARDYYQRMAEYAVELYRDEDAIRFATRAVALSPDDAVLHERLGHMYKRSQAPDRAIAEYRSAIAKNDRLFSAYFSLAELLTSRGQTVEADQLLRRVVRSAPEDDMIALAARLSLQLHLADGTVEALERDLLPLALSNPQKPVYRRLLIETYGALTVSLGERAQDPDATVRAGAEAELRLIGKRAVKPLLDALGDAQVSEQRVAIELLTHLKNESAAPALFAFAMSDADASLRQRAMLAAGAAPDAELARRIGALLFTDATPFIDEANPVSLAAVWALCRLPDLEAQKLVVRLLHTDAPSAKALAVLSLALHKPPKAAATVLPMLAQEHGALVRSAAAFALGELGDKRHIPALTPLRDSPDPRLRQAALIALARLGDVTSHGTIAEGLINEPANERAWVGSAVVLATGEYHAARPPFSVPRDRVDVPDILDHLVPSDPPLQARQRAFLRLAPDLAETIHRRALGADERLMEVVDRLITQAGTAAFSPLLGGEPRDATFSSEIQSALDALFLKITPDFVELCHHPSERVRGAALRFLGTRKDAAALACVTTGLADANEAVVRMTLAAVTHHPSQATLQAVVMLLEDHRGWPLRLLALQTLNHFGVLKSDLEDTPAWQAAVLRLSRIATSDAFALVRDAALETLVTLAGSSAMPTLSAAAASDVEPSVRAHATRLLGELRSPAVRSGS